MDSLGKLTPGDLATAPSGVGKFTPPGYDPKLQRNAELGGPRVDGTSTQTFDGNGHPIDSDFD